MKYELTILLNQEAELKNIKDLVTGLSGKIDKEENWGEKTLVYPIKEHQKAKFYNLVIDVPETKMGELRKKLNFNDKLIRFLLLIQS